jgi:predicted nucleotidyltransferase
MSQAYEAHLRRAAEVFVADDRVRAMWLTGAVARGAQDAASDLDVCLTVADDALDDLVATHESWIAQVTRPVNIERMGSATGWFVLTDTCERVDVLLETVSELATSPHTRRLAVFDKDGCERHLPAIRDPGPDAGVVGFCVTEAIRQMANLPVVFVRRDWLLGVVAVQQLHYFLYELFAQANRPQPPSGAKQWSSKLAAAHRALLEELPVPQPEPASIARAHRAAVDLFELHAPTIAADLGVDWPTAMHRAVRAYRHRVYPEAWFTA